MSFSSYVRRHRILTATVTFALAAAVVVGVVVVGGREQPAEEAVSDQQLELEIIRPQPAQETEREAEPEPTEELPAEPPVVETQISAPVELLPSVVSPLDGTTMTVFSMNDLLYDETMADWRTHNGVDIQAGEGDAVKTAAGGSVQSVTDNELMGTTVVVSHADGYATTYSSLQAKPPVQEGQVLTAGDVIGYVGNTAAAELNMGPHLHFSVSRNGSIINPAEYVK